MLQRKAASGREFRCVQAFPHGKKGPYIRPALRGGAGVYDLGRMTTPVTRYAVTALGVNGGLHVRLSPYDPDIALIEFLDNKGMNIDKATERK